MNIFKKIHRAVWARGSDETAAAQADNLAGEDFEGRRDDVSANEYYDSAERLLGDEFDADRPGPGQPR